MTRIQTTGIQTVVTILAAYLAALPASAADSEIEFERVRGRIVVPVALNDVEPYFFIVDAALRRPVIDSAVAEYLNLTVEGEPITVEDTASADPQSATVSETLELKLGADPTWLTPCAIVDLSLLSSQLGRAIGGMLPLHRAGTTVTIEFLTNTIRWSPSDGIRPGGDDVMPLHIGEQGEPAVPVFVRGKYLERMALDFTYPGTASVREVTLDIAEQPLKSLPQFRTALPNGSQQVQVRPEYFQVGVHRLDHPLCRLHARETRDRLGLAFLHRFTISMNYEAGWVRLASPARRHTGAPIRGAGILLESSTGAGWRIAVAESSPAARAGVLPGDILTHIDGRNVEATPIQIIENALITATRDAITLGLYREGASPYSVTLIAEELF